MLTLNNLNVTVSDHELLSNISITLFPGSIINFYGSNGIGKTSLLRKISSLEFIENEQILYNEYDVNKALDEYRVLLSYVGHENGLMENKTVFQNLEFWANIYNIEEAISASIKCFDLGQYIATPVSKLSKGWRRKVSLAKLLLNNSPVWIIDEPFANLDEPSIANLKNVFSGKVNQNGIVIIANHQKLEDENVINFNLEEFKNV